MASLASLLNPSPDSDTRRLSPPPSRGSQPSTAMSNEDSSNHSPTSVRSGTQQQFIFPPGISKEAAQALAKLSASPAPVPTHWNGYSEAEHLERQRSWERRQSGYGDPIQLPPPDVGASRKMSSPTLEQYHVASRSPEQRRPSVVSPPEHNVTLPPIQGLAAPSSEQHPQASYVSSNASTAQARSPMSASHANSAHAISSPQSEAHASQSEPLGRASASASVPHLKPTALIESANQEEGAPSPAIIKQEATTISQPSSPTDARQPDLHTSKTVASLKSEHTRTQSPLRESSVPIPTTEMPPKEEPSLAPKKRSVPAKTKKGTASTVKRDKAPPAKKRKVEIKRSETPSSLASKTVYKKGNSSKGTPLNSSPAPSTRSYSAEPDEEQFDEEDIDEDMAAGSDTDLYCICHKPDNGTFMIGCDGTCDDWFHGRCVGIEERDKNLIDKYICPSCTKAGVGRTTWKRICRRPGCRQAARAGKTKNGSHGSKYCSEDCGVLFFREMVARTRGNEDKQRDRAARRKGSLDVSGSQLRQEDDVGARGGALAAGEVKALLDTSNSVEEFRKLGDGVLSPPATPDGKDEKISAFTEAELAKLQVIAAEKDEARRRHALLKDRLKFVTLVKQAASRTATEKELKPKEYCGYDSRLEWTQQRFQDWRNTKAGQQAIDLETLATEKTSERDEVSDDETPQICDRKKCARHLEWSKLAVDDLRFEMGDNGDRMRALDTQEQEIKQTAALRAKSGNINGEGTVEVHGVEVIAEKMDVDAPLTNGHANVVETVENTEPMAVDAA